MKTKRFNKLENINDGAKSAVVYTIAILFSRGLAIITVPIFTRIMTSSQIGVVNIYNSWYSLISSVATLSLTSGGYIVALKEYEKERDQYQSAVLSLTSVVSIIIATVYFIAPTFWSGILGLPIELVVLMLIGFLFAPARDFWLARERFEYKYKKVGLVIIISALLASGLSIIAVLVSNKNAPDNVVNARLFSNYAVIYLVSGIIWFRTMIKGKVLYNREYWRLSLSLSIPLVGYSIASQILSVSDRMMISSLVDNRAVGIYSTLFSVSSLSLIVWQAIHSSFVPYLYQKIGTEENNVKLISTCLLIVYAFAAILLTFMAPEIVKILAPGEYYEAIYIMPPIAAGIYLNAFSNIYADIVVYYKKTKYVMYPALIAAISNVVLNYFFISIFGYIAAAYTTLVSNLLLAYCQAKWAKKVCRENESDISTIYDGRLLVIISLITVAISLLGLLLYVNLMFRIVAIIIVVFVIILSFSYAQKRGMVDKYKRRNR